MSAAPGRPKQARTAGEAEGTPAGARAWRARRLLGGLITASGLVMLCERAYLQWLA